MTPEEFQRVLDNTEDQLKASEPALARSLGIFARLYSDEDMPEHDQLKTTRRSNGLLDRARSAVRPTTPPPAAALPAAGLARTGPRHHREVALVAALLIVVVAVIVIVATALSHTSQSPTLNQGGESCPQSAGQSSVNPAASGGPLFADCAPNP